MIRNSTMPADPFGLGKQLDRIEAKLDSLLAALAEDDIPQDNPRQSLDEPLDLASDWGEITSATSPFDKL